jgi:hypothetical protein
MDFGWPKHGQLKAGVPVAGVFPPTWLQYPCSGELVASVKVRVSLLSGSDES